MENLEDAVPVLQEDEGAVLVNASDIFPPLYFEYLTSEPTEKRYILPKVYLTALITQVKGISTKALYTLVQDQEYGEEL